MAVVELLLLLLIGGGKLAGLVSDRVQVAARDRALAGPVQPTAAPTTRRPKAIPRVSRSRSKTVVTVLNGNGRTGAAAGAAARVRSHGYRVATVGNATPTPRTIVMFRPGFAGEGRRLARDLGIRLVGPLDGIRPRDLGRAQVVLVLGP